MTAPLSAERVESLLKRLKNVANSTCIQRKTVNRRKWLTKSSSSVHSAAINPEEATTTATSTSSGRCGIVGTAMLLARSRNLLENFLR